MLTSLFSLFYVTGECYRFKAYTEDEPFSRLALLICITIKSSMYARQFWAIL